MSSLKEDWRGYYGEKPYSESEGGVETPPEDTARSTMSVLEKTGVLAQMANETKTLFFSSVSRGERSFETAKLLNAWLEQHGITKRQKVLVSDFAMAPDGNPVVEKAPEHLPHVQYEAIASDSYKLPLRDESIDVIHERFGALYHSAELGTENIDRLIEEYRRVLVPGGMLYIDAMHENERLKSSTASALLKAIDDSIENHFKKFGFDAELVDGGKEHYLVLTKRADRR